MEKGAVSETQIAEALKIERDENNKTNPELLTMVNSLCETGIAQYQGY